METLNATIGGLTLFPHFLLVETTQPAETDVRTLDNTLYTDFINVGRSWEITFPELCKTDYDDIYALYRSQYVAKSYLLFICQKKDIDTVVKLNIGTTNIFWNGDLIKDFQLNLVEKSGNV